MYDMRRGALFVVVCGFLFSRVLLPSAYDVQIAKLELYVLRAHLSDGDDNDGGILRIRRRFGHNVL